MIDRFHLHNFKGHRDTEVPLRRFTVLVGDNASGKTSVLEAMWIQATLGRYPAWLVFGDYPPGELLRRNAEGPIVLGAEGRGDAGPWRTSIEMSADSTDDTAWQAALRGERGEVPFTASASGKKPEAHDGWRDIAATIGSAGLYRFHAETIAAAAYSSTPRTPVGMDGTNTAVALAVMKLGSDENFLRVEEALRRLVPAVRRVRIQRAKVPWAGNEKKGEVIGDKIHFDFVGASDVPAQRASHGTLIVLSLLTVLYGANRPNLILLDDFDHALHPRAQMELVRMINELLTLEEFSGLQVVATTHSPYVLDRLEPSDVQVFALRDDGTVASKRLSAHPEAERMKGALTAGQLWSLDDERKWVVEE